MFDDLLAAAALVLVFEGIMPFMNPMRWKSVMRRISDQKESTLRALGLMSMLAGIVVLYLVRH